MTTNVDEHGKAPDATTEAQKLNDNNQVVLRNRNAQGGFMTKDKEYWIPGDFLIFEVENTLFRVLKHHFIKSRFFLAMLEPPKVFFEEDATARLGHSLRNVTVKEFRSFLDVLGAYPQPPNKNLISGMSKDELTAILKLSTMWHFPDHRQAVIAQLSRILYETSKIEIGIKYRIAAFLNSGIEYMITRSEQIMDEEAVLIGPLVTVALFRLRETWKSLRKAERTDAKLRGLITGEGSLSSQLKAIGEDERRFNELSVEATSSS
ncbi:hypothetical protein BDN70DRAFT_939523 [Pholiota conissans]|uniref:BTB domain-containing protein n=1 Tax=Pholiota conissans TaxID=109636 RepID=A0A9P6CKY6_9AGAR|nr:hypothetical protein BDN70DRAFT_939644 [Pholiota conissans]KAF9470661.1 hypothetical protein BDN70DRAFT_939523 [Pholiota conissans]